MNLGDLLIAEGLVDSAAVEEAQALALRQERSLIQVLVDQDHLAEDAAADAVAKATGTVVVDIELGALDQESVQLIPEGVARRHLLIAVARDPGGGRLRVAFANPLDEAAMAAVREATGLEIDPMVATVTGLAAAVDREYTSASTAVMRGSPERGARGAPRDLMPEDTRRIQDADLQRVPTGAGTSPMHRLEQEASPEQRHEALLLALVDAGVLTRSDYIAALRRLKGKP